VQVPFQFLSYLSQSAKSAERFISLDPYALQRSLSSATANFANSIASHPPYKRELYSHHTLVFPQVNTVERPKLSLQVDPSPRKTGTIGTHVGSWVPHVGVTCRVFDSRCYTTSFCPIRSMSIKILPLTSSSPAPKRLRHCPLPAPRKKTEPPEIPPEMLPTRRS